MLNLYFSETKCHNSLALGGNYPSWQESDQIQLSSFVIWLEALSLVLAQTILVEHPSIGSQFG